MMHPCLSRCVVMSVLASGLHGCGGGGGSDDASSGGGSSSSANPYTVGGMVNGLSPGASIVLRLNGGNDLPVTATGSFTFSNAALANGASYAVSVATQPSTTNQVCNVTAGGNGTINGANVTNVAVNCADYSIGGSISGLTGNGLVLQLNDANDLSVNTGNSFTFPPSASLGGPVYVVHIKTQPAGQTCTIVKSTGVVSASLPTVNDIDVECIGNVTDALVGTYRGQTYQGQAIDTRAFLTFYADGTYIFGLHEDNSSCTANNGNGLEYGVYRWNQTSHAFAFVTAALDTNGDCGVIDPSNPYPTGTLVKNNDGTLTTNTLDTNGSGNHVVMTWAPVPSTSGELIGSWGDNQNFTLYGSDGTLFNADTRAFVQVPSAVPGIEDGCYLLSGATTSGSYTLNFSSTCAVSGTQTGIDTSGALAGLSLFGSNAVNFTVSGDSLQFTVPGIGLTTPLTEVRITTN